ncbi:MAG: DUF1592 domain-containing protein [Bryobacteraceae bacterium]
MPRILHAATALVCVATLPAAHAQEPSRSLPQRSLIDTYCAGCHSKKLKTAGLVLEGLDASRPQDNPGLWEKVIRQIQGRQMPPPGLPRPDAAASTEFTSGLIQALDRSAARQPDPGATRPHRLNRIEYSNAVRDLLGIDTHPGAALPVDESGNGFDNMADLLSMSPALLERYLSVARSVSRLAVGDLKTTPADSVYGSTVRGANKGRNPEDLPLGAASGLVFEHYFPLDATYDLRVKLAGGADDPDARPYDKRLAVKAGMHRVTAVFLSESGKAEVALRATGRRPTPGAPAAAAPQAELDLRLDGASIQRFQVPQRAGTPEVGTVTIHGPESPTGRGDTPSRRKIFVCHPTNAAEEEPCAGKILAHLTDRGFRRPTNSRDWNPLLAFYKQARSEGADFDDAIGRAVQALLVSPDFLFRVERDRKGAAPGSSQRLGDYELASRLSFFLWSSIPDDELLEAARQGKLSDPAALQQQMRRMIADPRSDALIENFGGQWLYLRTLTNAKPDADLFPNFDDDLRYAFRRETELLLTSVFRNGDSVLDLLTARYTFLNQRLAQHYKIPGVYGSHFRRVELGDSPRGGLLGQGSILTVTSYPNRTSVVQRGKWILENLLGTPPPPPPGEVPELKPTGKDGRKLSLREAMEQHRANPVCASCHGRMDPIGFALENFNAVGEWRAKDGAVSIDAKGKLPNGAEFDGPTGLEQLLVNQHKEQFVQTVAEKLLMYALGRGLEPHDRPTVRTILVKAARDDYRMPAFIEAIVESTPFQMRRTSEK